MSRIETTVELPEMGLLKHCQGINDDEKKKKKKHSTSDNELTEKLAYIISPECYYYTGKSQVFR